MQESCRLLRVFVEDRKHEQAFHVADTAVLVDCYTDHANTSLQSRACVLLSAAVCKAVFVHATDICACLARCVRTDETSATVRCHYLTDGTANFAFTVRRQEFFVPVGVLLKCFLEVSDRELSEKLLACCAEVSCTSPARNAPPYSPPPLWGPQRALPAILLGVWLPVAYPPFRGVIQ